MKMIFGNLGIESGDNTVSVKIGAATRSNECLFTVDSVEKLCDLLRRAAIEARVKVGPITNVDDDLFDGLV